MDISTSPLQNPASNSKIILSLLLTKNIKMYLISHNLVRVNTLTLLNISVAIKANPERSGDTMEMSFQRTGECAGMRRKSPFIYGREDRLIAEDI